MTLVRGGRKLTASALAFASLILTSCASVPWQKGMDFDVRLLNSGADTVTVKYCGNGGIEFCTTDLTVAPGACSDVLTIGNYSADQGRAAIFEIVGPGRTNGYVAVKPTDNNQLFDAAPRWPSADAALKSPATVVSGGCG